MSSKKPILPELDSLLLEQIAQLGELKLEVGEGVQFRGKGRKPLANSFLTTEQWEQLQQQPGESKEDHKRRYQRAINASFRARHKERLATERKEHERKGGKWYESKVKWREANPDKQIEYQKRYFDAHPERIQKLVEWRKENKEQLRVAQSAWWKANRGKACAWESKSRAAVKQAIPLWADLDKVTEFYVEANRVSRETGIEHHVDHIIPLRGKTVCGLHVENNLRVVSKEVNMAKRNYLDEALALDASATDYVFVSPVPKIMLRSLGLMPPSNARTALMSQPIAWSPF